ncbi:MAG: bifunctional phosphoribosyl-AMP cyclohydrolase/phosphoribosyl-ATP diphosphatase HisIE [Bacilli bacterium]
MNVVFDKAGLIPAIVVDAWSNEVLTLAYMNAESLQRTQETGETWFYSRSRQELWHKGATSGHTQKVISITTDCDSDALVVKVLPNGPACHNGTTSCFTNELMRTENAPTSLSFLLEIEQLLTERKQTPVEGSYTSDMLQRGVDRIGKKIGEEAAEVIIAAKNKDKQEITWEASDLLFHLMLLLKSEDVSLNEVLQHLGKRKK